ncbi:hypothetical protein [Rhizobium terricola]|uniref:Uncharacterized protein n=1 Tax=Rhizobium terricola TaxID=2728849 RepID=A0A7Y0AVN0_9HYPH|nr:hypothetical protein [Rhizobium terricola]NML74336.1 hypothetical protein [Rhizobium terricola]
MLARARLLLTSVGLVLALIGLVWAGQGSGFFPYPASSFMINQSPWIAYGALTTIVGLGLVWTAQRFLR